MMKDLVGAPRYLFSDNLDAHTPLCFYVPFIGCPYLRGFNLRFYAFVSKLSTRSLLIICPLIFSSIGPRMPFVLILPSLSLFPAPRSNWVIVLYQLLVPVFGMSYRRAFVVAVNCLGSRAVLSLIFFLPNFFPSPFL